MEKMKKAENLITYALEELELSERDADYKFNRLLEIYESGLEGEKLDDAVYGELSLLPSEMDKRFSEILEKDGSKAATDWLFHYCVKNGYVKKALLDKNPRFDMNGLTITINKSKPEFKDPNKAKKENSVDGGLAQCVICRANEGFAPRNKRTLRTVSIKLGGEDFFWQYSPYGYFNEHGIAVNCKHTPMYVDKSTFHKLMDFVDIFPHYFIGCNAPLESIGGSVLSHDHYQGGGETLPLHRAKIVKYFKDKYYPRIEIGILDWPGTVIRIIGKERNAIAEVSEKIRKVWTEKDVEHNAISPTVLKTNNGYEMNIILRSNITSKQYPHGIYHAHQEYHCIKKESIGLIEAQGLFILPGRLESQLAEVAKCIEKGELPKELKDFELVYNEVRAMNNPDIHKAMQEELGSICYRILENTAVYKTADETGKFLKEVGFNE